MPNNQTFQTDEVINKSFSQKIAGVTIMFPDL